MVAWMNRGVWNAGPVAIFIVPWAILPLTVVQRAISGCAAVGQIRCGQRLRKRGEARKKQREKSCQSREFASDFHEFHNLRVRA